MKKNVRGFDDRLTLRIDSTLKQQVFEKAERYDLSVSQITQRLLQLWVEDGSMLSGDVGAELLPKHRKK
jgi:predicted HicB family RNase H-like nuclease